MQVGRYFLIAAKCAFVLFFLPDICAVSLIVLVFMFLCLDAYWGFQLVVKPQFLYDVLQKLILLRLMK